MTKLGIVVVLCTTLGGCASLNYIMAEYQGVTVQEVRMPDDTYRIFDKPTQSKLMVTSSLASATGQGVSKGLTFGAASGEPPKPLFEAAALQYLNESGRPSCRVTDAYVLAQPQWEVKYDCSPPATVPTPTMRARKPSGT